MAEEDNEQTAETRPFLSVEDFESVIRQGIEDYDDGDQHPGYFGVQWNPGTSELALNYRPDDDAGAEYRPTTHVFRYGAQARVGGPSLGEVAFAGYKAQTRGVSLADGSSLPAWGVLDGEMQAAWEAAADAVRRAV